jgi:hypothetical protein
MLGRIPLSALALTFVFCAALTTCASAHPRLRISWDACDPPVVHKFISPGQANVDLYVSAVGQDDPHQGYQLTLEVWSQVDCEQNTVHDAWRFDASGCQGPGAMTIDHLAPAAVAKTCPSFQGDAPSSIVVSGYTYDSMQGKARLELSNTYPDGVLSPNPGTRSMLLHVGFDMTRAVNGAGNSGETCGGLENPTCIHVLQAYWFDIDGQGHPIDIETPRVSANDPSQGAICFGCDPVIPTTWGSIKGQYH